MGVNIQPPVQSAHPIAPARFVPANQVIQPPRVRNWEILVWCAAALFFGISTAVSWLRWWNFQYRTFDLAYYVQAVFQLIHGRLAVSVENVPLLGNHVEPIVFLFAPLFAIVRHPMLFVVLQNAALASMALVGYRMTQPALGRRNAALLSVTLLLTPASVYVALHEFHPEALSAPLLLTMLYNRAHRRLWLYWGCFVGVLACKENMALLLAAYGCVFLLIERKRGAGELMRWYGGPLLVAVVWFVLCIKVITPALNSGNIDYLSLYDRLGNNPGEILRNLFTRPQLAGTALFQAVVHGNLVWGLLVPFLGLPLLRPRWLIIAAPILLQHLLSWRSSEWQIYFHYAAPLVPLLWIASVEALVLIRDRSGPVVAEERAPTRSAVGQSHQRIAGDPLSVGLAPDLIAAGTSALLLVCLTAQIWIGPARAISAELLNQSRLGADRQRKIAFLRKIPAEASVVAPLPYLSHLAMRENLYSLHYILKGLKTLSRKPYDPPRASDFVLIDYGDSATFDPAAGYYHPEMRTVNGDVIPSSDRLLNQFLARASWTVESMDDLALFQQPPPGSEEIQGDHGPKITQNPNGGFAAEGNQLREVAQLPLNTSAPGEKTRMALGLRWVVQNGRNVFPWMNLRMTRLGGSEVKVFTKGLCAVEATDGSVKEIWRTALPGLPAGEYAAELILTDQPKSEWAKAHGQSQPHVLVPPVRLGQITVAAAQE